MASSSPASGALDLDPRLQVLQRSGADVSQSSKFYAHLLNLALLTKCFVKEIIESHDDMFIISTFPKKIFEVLAIG